MMVASVMVASGLAMRSLSVSVSERWACFLQWLENALTADFPQLTGEPEVDRQLIELYLKSREM
jgi:hypothetical protein